MAVVRRVIHNPADVTQGYKLWSNGVIQPIGTAPPAGFVIPDGFGDLSAQDFAVVDWLTPSGYVLSWTGVVFAFGGATPATGYQNTGGFHIWRKLIMNPAGNGAGYEMDFRGRIYRFGPVPPPNVGGDAGTNVNGLAGGIDWGGDEARDLFMDWGTKRYVILRRTGQLYSPNGITFAHDAATPRPLLVGFDGYRGVTFRDPTLTGSSPGGYLTTYSGRIYGFNAVPHLDPFAAYGERDVVTGLVMYSDGLAGRPLTLELVHRDGPRKLVTISAPPTIAFTVPGVSETITTTQRPPAVWNYSDPDGDTQARAVIRLFKNATVLLSDFTPEKYATSAYAEWIIEDARTFTVAPDFDLPNGNYRYYGLVTDSAGDVSVWAWVAFTVNVAALPVPTITALATPGLWHSTVTVTAGAATPANMAVVLEYADDPLADPAQDPGDHDGTWQVVHGATAIPYPASGPKVVTVLDHQAPFNRLRRYRARTIDPVVGRASASSTAALAAVATDEWALTDPTTGEGVELFVQPSFGYTRDTATGVHRPLGRGTAVVSSMGVQSAEFDVTLRTETRDQFEALEALVASERTLQFRDPYERTFFVEIVGSLGVDMLEVAPARDETTEFAFAHTTSCSVVEVDRPDP